MRRFGLALTALVVMAATLASAPAGGQEEPGRVPDPVLDSDADLRAVAEQLGFDLDSLDVEPPVVTAADGVGDDRSGGSPVGPDEYAPRRVRPAPWSGTVVPGAELSVRAGDAPVGVRIDPVLARGGVDTVSALSVDVLDAEVAESFGAALVWRVGDVSAVEFEIDYSSFAELYGAEFWSRVEVLALPACVLETPELAECSAFVELDASTVNVDRVAETVSFSGAGIDDELVRLRAAAAVGDLLVSRVAVIDVDVQAAARERTATRLAVEAEPDPAVAGVAEQVPVEPESSSSTSAAAAIPSPALAPVGGGTIFLLSAGSSSGEGDYGALPTSLLGQWSSSPGSGNFAYSYPFDVVDVPGGLVPDLGLVYSSSAVDRMTSSTNAQTSPIGLGWSMPVASVSRSYRTWASSTGHRDSGSVDVVGG